LYTCFDMKYKLIFLFRKCEI